MGMSNEQQEPAPVKICCGKEIRRFTLSPPTYASLCETTVSLFRLPQVPLAFTYVDDVGDTIAMSSDIEFREAIRITKTSILRLAVEVASQQSDKHPCSQSSYEIFAYNVNYMVHRQTCGKHTAAPVNVGENGAERNFLHDVNYIVHRQTCGEHTAEPADVGENGAERSFLHDVNYIVHHQTCGEHTAAPANVGENGAERPHGVNHTVIRETFGEFSPVIPSDYVASSSQSEQDWCEAISEAKRVKRALKQQQKGKKEEMKQAKKDRKKDLKKEYKKKKSEKNACLKPVVVV